MLLIVTVKHYGSSAFSQSLCLPEHMHYFIETLHSRHYQYYSYRLFIDEETEA